MKIHAQSPHIGRTAAFVLGFLGILASASPVAAECSEPPIPTNVGAYVGYAFQAWVAKVSNHPRTRIPGDAPFSWEVVLDVSHVYRGSVPDRTVVDGWDVGCGWFRGRSLKEDQVIFVTSSQLELPTLGANLLVWQREGDQWRFDYDTTGPNMGRGPGLFPAAAEKARTTSGLVALFGPDALPSTDVGLVATSAEPAGTLLIVALAALGAGWAIERRRLAGLSRAC